MAEHHGRDRALADIVALARQHGLTGADIASALGGAPEGPGEGRTRATLVKVLGLLGGTFVFAGVGVFIALQWSAMNTAERIVSTFGSGLAAFVLAALAYRDARFDKAAAPLLLVAAALEPTGMLVTFQELGSGGDWHIASLITSATMALQLGATFAAVRRSTPLFATLAFATLFWITALDYLSVDAKLIAMAVGGALLLASIGVDRTRHREITPAWSFVGAAAFLYGLFDAVRHTPFELAFIAAAAGFVYLSVELRARTLLFVATLAILAYTGWFTSEHFADSVGWPLSLVGFGLFMIGLSALAFRIDRVYLRARPAP